MSTTTSLRGYAPNEGSTPWKVIEFLTTNPDEALSASDIEAKFGKPRAQVHSALGPAITAGVLKREEDLKEGELLYRLDKGHPAVQANSGRNPSLRSEGSTAASTPPPRGRRHRVVLDATSLELEEDVPLPPISTGRRLTDWPALFGRMKPGNSVLLPRAVKATLGKAISLYHAENEGAELATRMVDDEHIRLWRVA